MLTQSFSNVHTWKNGFIQKIAKSHKMTQNDLPKLLHCAYNNSKHNCLRLYFGENNARYVKYSTQHYVKTYCTKFWKQKWDSLSRLLAYLLTNMSSLTRAELWKISNFLWFLQKMDSFCCSHSFFVEKWYDWCPGIRKWHLFLRIVNQCPLTLLKQGNCTVIFAINRLIPRVISKTPWGARRICII